MWSENNVSRETLISMNQKMEIKNVSRETFLIILPGVEKKQL